MGICSNLKNTDILLLTPRNICQLKDFTNFIYSTDVRRPIKFSFVDGEGQLINKLTLKENIFLESIPTSLAQSKEFQLETYLKKTRNINLIRLFKKVSLLDVYPDKIDDQTRKIVALIKGLLQEADYLFLEHPEKHLSSTNLDLFIKAMEYQNKTLPQIIVIGSANAGMWTPFISKLIRQDEFYQYSLEEVSVNQIKEKYLSPDQEPTENVLPLPFWGDKEKTAA